MVEITSNGGGPTAAITIAENIAPVTTITATGFGTLFSYAIVGGADASKFTINATTGALNFAASPDFELPADSGANNVYDVQVQATDLTPEPPDSALWTLTVDRVLTSGTVTSDVPFPIFATSAPGDLDNLYVINRQLGEIKTYDLDTGTLDAVPFLTLPPELFLIGSSFSNHTAYAIAFDPNYEVNRKLFVSFVDLNQKLRVVEFTAPADGNGPVDTSVYRNVITIDYGPPQTGGRHYGGDIDFGPDGYLYLTTGDNNALNGSPTELPGGVRSQGLDNLEGKVLRINPYADAFAGDDANNFTPAADNPFITAGSPVAVTDAIWATGLRNPFQASFGPNGDYYLSDVGEDHMEEINLGAAGANYGWPLKEGSLPFPIGTTLTGGITFTDPLFEYAHPAGDFTASVSGGLVYMGTNALMQGQYFFGDYVTNKVWSFTHTAGSSTVSNFKPWNLASDEPLPSGIISFAVSADGDLIIVAGNGIYKITGSSSGPTPATDVQAIAVTITDVPESVTRTGTEGNDLFSPSLSVALQFRTTALSDMVFGLGGNDTIYGGNGADQMHGGGGDDSYTVEVTGDQTIEIGGAGNDTVYAYLDWTIAENIENLKLINGAGVSATGNELNNRLTGNTLANIVTGLGGNDTINGDAGADAMIGGVGNDIYVVDNTGDTITELNTEGTDTVLSTITHTLAAFVDHLTLQGTGLINGIGNGLVNNVTGNASDNQLTGLGGNDRLDGGVGNDVAIYTGNRSTYQITIQASGTVTVADLRSGAPDGTDTNSRIETLQFADGTYNVATGVFTPTQGNQAPSLINPVAGPAYAEGSSWSFTVPANTFSDPDGDLLVYSAELLVNAVYVPVPVSSATGLTFNPASRSFTNANQGADFDGAYSIRLKATDPSGASATTLFTIDITPVNDAPTVANLIVDQAASEGAAWSLALAANTFADVDGDTLTYSATLATGAALPAWLQFDAATRSFSGTPPAGSAGAISLRVTATDNGTGPLSVFDDFILTITPASNGVTLTGTVGADVFGPSATRPVNLRTTALNDVVFALDGNDSIDGGGGADTTHGGIGNDAYYVNVVGDQTVEIADQGTDTVYATLNWILANHVDNLKLLNGAAVTGTGNVLNNSLTGNTSTNTLNGLEGNDRLDGDTGADFLFGGTGSDTYMIDNVGDTVTDVADAGIDIVFSTISHTLGAWVENLTLLGTGPIGAVNGSGNDLANTISGNAFSNTLSGLGGSDMLNGFAGQDVVRGGAGADILSGGVDADRFVFEIAAFGVVDTVKDFTQGSDLLQFTMAELDLATVAGNLQNGAVASLGHAQFVYNAATSTLSWDANGVAGGEVGIAKLSGIATLAVSDFVLV